MGYHLRSGKHTLSAYARAPVPTHTTEVTESVPRLSPRHRGIVHDLIAMPHTL